MKKFFTALFAVCALVFTGVVAAPAASAAPSVDVAVSAEVSTVAKVSPVTRNLAGGVIKPFWTLSHCYFAIDTYTYCWRTNCTQWEYWFYGCRNNTWYKVPRVWYA